MAPVLPLAAITHGSVIVTESNERISLSTPVLT
jgi:hypothetical protein